MEIGIDQCCARQQRLDGAGVSVNFIANFIKFMYEKLLQDIFYIKTIKIALFNFILA